MNNNIGRPNSLDLVLVSGFMNHDHMTMYIPSRTLNVVDVYGQYQYVHKS